MCPERRMLLGGDLEPYTQFSILRHPQKNGPDTPCSDPEIETRAVLSYIQSQDGKADTLTKQHL